MTRKNKNLFQSIDLDKYEFINIYKIKLHVHYNVEENIFEF